MRDDYLSADWARSHGQVTSAINALFRAIAVALYRLHDIQFEAPWEHEPTRR